MEYSNEILFKVFTTYAGCEMILEKSGRIAKLCGVAFDGMIISLDDGEDMRNYEYFPFKPILTPLSAITDEHAIYIATREYNKRVGKCNIKSTRVYRTSVGIEVELYAGENQTMYIQRWGIGCKTHEHDLEYIDKLREWGYDCGYAEIPSLIGAGLAIDKTTLNN